MTESRQLVGRVLLVSSLMMVVLAACFWWSVIPVGGAVRGYAALAVLCAAAVDAWLGMRLLGGSK